MAKTQKVLAAEELYDRCDKVIETYSERDSDLDELETYYFLEQEHDEEAGTEEEGIETVRLPYGTNAVDLVQDLLAGADLTITVPALSEGQQHKKLADTAEGFLRAVWEQSSRAQKQDLMSRAAWLVAMRGQLAGRVLAMPAWLDKATNEAGESSYEQKGRRVPLLLQLRDPRYVYPCFGVDGLAYVVERRTRTVLDVRNTIGDEDLLPDSDEDEEIEWTEYWDETRFCYWAGGEVTLPGGGDKPLPHTYGGIPYVFEFARQTGRLEPEKRARPLLASSKNVIDRLELLDSQEATFIAQYNGDALIAFTQDQDAKLDLRPGAVSYLQPDERVEWLRASRQPIEMDKAHGKYSAELEKATFPNTMFGMDPGRLVAGYAINLLNQSGQLRIAPMVACLERALSELFENCLMVCEHYLQDLLGGPVTFYQLSDSEDDAGGKYKATAEQKLDASKFGGFYWVEVQLADLMPADEQANVILAGRSREQGPDGRPLLSWETAVERFKLTDSPTEERDRIDREIALADPEIAELRKAIVMARLKQELMEELVSLDVDPKAVLAQLQQRQQPPPQALQPEIMPQVPGAPPGMMPPGMMPPGMMPPGMMPPGMMPPVMQGQLMPQPMGAMMPEEGMPPPPPGIMPGGTM